MKTEHESLLMTKKEPASEYDPGMAGAGVKEGTQGGDILRNAPSAEAGA